MLRRTTERPEGVEAGTARLIGTEREAIRQAAAELLSQEAAYRQMAHAVNPYGDGRASHRIVEALAHVLGDAPRPVDFRPGEVSSRCT